MPPPAPEPIRLRPHHFLCLLTYGGAGYTPAFVANLDRIAAELSSGGAVVRVVEGPDDICGPMLCVPDHPSFHCHNASVQERDGHALREVGEALARLGSSPGRGFRVCFAIGEEFVLTRAVVAALRREFASGAIRKGCAGCEWHPRCTERAARGFEGARLACGGDAEPSQSGL